MITGKTKVIGIFGNPIEHSLSPVIHNAAFRALGLDYCYVPFNVSSENLGTAINAIRSLQLVGVNITIPFKERVIPFLDELSPEAQLMGAVNTIVNRQGHLVGHNTDGLGFVESLQQQAGLSPVKQRFLILGSGGAARGIALALGVAGAEEIILVNRHLERAEDLSRNLQDCSPARIRVSPWENEELAQLITTVDVLINTTPVGMFPHHSQSPAVPINLLQPHQLVCDIIYSPLKTLFLQQAEAKGCKIVPGWGMLLYQAILAFQLWTGQEPPVEVMQQTLLARLSPQQ